MTARRVFRASTKTPAERAREHKLRAQLQEERSSLDDLIQSGACQADAVMTMGMYFDIQRALQALKRERQQSGLSIGEVAERSGLDRAVISRLENGKQDNPTVVTLMRYAGAVGKRFLWSYANVASKASRGSDNGSRRRTKGSAPNAPSKAR